jgi:signal transduction histidine kinase
MTITDPATKMPDSGTLGAVSTTPVRRPPSYWRLWAGVPRELGFLVLTFPIALVGFVTTVTLLSAGAGTLVTFFIGVFLLIGALYVSRGFGILELLRLEWAGRPRIERPEWQDARARQGFWGWLRSVVGNGHYWLYLLHTLVINFAVSLITWVITIVWVSVGLGSLSYGLWWRALPHDGGNWYLADWALGLFGATATGATREALEVVFTLLVGVIMVALLPFITRGLVLLHHVIARVVLGAFRSDALQREVIALSASRGAAVSAEGHSLRRLERDIHDGPQQRLVRLQMDLAAADRQLDTDPGKARALMAEAMVQSREALEELRALSRGFAPPILLDRGLVAALESLTVRSPIPIRLVNELDAGVDLPQEIERNAYFVASELLTNVAKHSSATDIELWVGLRRVPEPDATWLDVTVTDNGTGGATVTDGHGLAGLDERLRGLGGILTVSSPLGGPTVVTAHLPVTY